MIGPVNPGLNVHNRLKIFACFVIKGKSLQRLHMDFRPQIVTVAFALIEFIIVAADFVNVENQC